MFRQITIRHPEWLEHSDPQKALNLYQQGKLPSAVAGWMIVVGLKHPLRAIYGSNLRAGLALTWDALREEYWFHVECPLERSWGLIRFEYARAYSFVYYKFGHKIGGRRVDPNAIRCECGWGGMRRWAVHTYGDDGTGEDVEPVDECPACGGEL